MAMTPHEIAASAKFHIGGKISLLARDSIGKPEGQRTVKWNMSTTYPIKKGA
jgi:hypothetical protein